MSIGSNLRHLREIHGITQAKLAEDVGVSQSMINQIEQDRKVPTLALSKQIANVLKCTTDDFVDDMH